MKQSADLKRLLTSIDHKSYPAYKDVRGAYDFNTYILSIDMYRVTRLHLLPRSVSRSATRKPDFRQNSLIRRGKNSA